MLGDARLAQGLAQALDERGVYVAGFFFPVVPKGEARIRTQMSAALTTEDDRLCGRRPSRMRARRWELCENGSRQVGSRQVGSRQSGIGGYQAAGFEVREGDKAPTAALPTADCRLPTADCRLPILEPHP